MSEKRFRLAEDSNGLLSIFDNEDKEDEPLIYGAMFGTDKIGDLLNEQQATINKLNDELELTANTKLYSRRELERKVDEQQAEIERLQKIIDLTQYQLKVQDRILKEVGE